MARVEITPLWSSVLAGIDMETLRRVRICGNIMGALAASVRPELYMNPLAAAAHVGIAHPAIAMTTWCISHALPKSLFDPISDRYGWRFAAMTTYIAVHLSLYAAFSLAGIMPGGHAGIVATMVKPFGLFIACGLIARYSDRVFPIGSRKWAGVAEVIAFVSAAGFIGMCI